jgi:hypothetical protein
MTSILITAVTYFVFFQFNDWLFSSFELHSGANWIYLPAGLRLLCTLLLGIEGAIGIFIAALAISLSNLAHIDFTTMLVSSVISAAMPYLAYRIALHFGMPPSLENLSVKILFALTFLYALLNSVSHSLWYRLRGVSPDSLNTFFVMFIGDLIGTLLIIYSIKFILVFLDQFRKKE